MNRSLLITATFFLTILFFTAHAQDCKPDKSVNDKFTRQKYDYFNYDLKGTWNMLKDITITTSFSFVVVGDTQVIASITYIRSAPKEEHDLQPLRISKGVELYIANDAASVKLVCTRDAISKNKTEIFGNINQTLIAEYALSVEDLDTFSKQVFDQVLINLDGAPGQKANIKKKEGTRMQTDAKCLLPKIKKS